MPTRIATLGRERSIAKLARRVFEFASPPNSAEQLRAQAALLRANPRLATASGFRVGAIVVVPGVRGLVPSPEVAEAKAEPKGPINETSLRLQASAAGIDENVRRANKRAETLLKQIESPAFKRELARGLPEAQPLFDKARERLDASSVANEKKGAALRSAIDEAMKTIAKLEKLAALTRTS